MDYPDELLRGIPNVESCLLDGYPTAALFQFEASKTQEPGQDVRDELSINWRDDDGALDLLYGQKRPDGNVQFKGGAAVLSREELDGLRRRPLARDRLSYERHAIPGNLYHGNLLLAPGTPKPVKRMIEASIAMMCVVETLKRPE